MFGQALLTFDSSALGMLQCLGRHCVTCEVESEPGSSLDVCLSTTGIPSTCSHAKKTEEVFLQRTALPIIANLRNWTFGTLHTASTILLYVNSLRQ